MKITIEINYPGNSCIHTYEDKQWDKDLDQMLEIFQGLLKSAGFSFDGDIIIQENDDE